MKDIFGIDGCKFGWVVAEERTKGDLSIRLIKDLNDLESISSQKVYSWN